MAERSEGNFTQENIMNKTEQRECLAWRTDELCFVYF